MAIVFVTNMCARRPAGGVGGRHHGVKETACGMVCDNQHHSNNPESLRYDSVLVPYSNRRMRRKWRIPGRAWQRSGLGVRRLGAACAAAQSARARRPSWCTRIPTRRPGQSPAPR